MQPRYLMYAPDLQPGDVVYEVQPGDSLWSITENFFGSGEEGPVVYRANIGRKQPDGRTFTEAGQIRPGWALLIPGPPEGAVEVDADGKRWYTVSVGDNLWSISARSLGDGRRWPKVFELNRGAQSPDGHTLVDPNLIWPDLRLQLPNDAPAVTQPTNDQAPSEPDRAPAVEPPPPVPTPEAAPTAATPASVPSVPALPPAALPVAAAWSVATPEPVVSEAPVRTTPIDGSAPSADGEVLGHLLVASEPGSSDAREHLAAAVASLAARRPPDRVRLYTVAAPDDALGQLAGLPHQSVVVDPADSSRVAQVLASLRSEVQRREESAQSPGEVSGPS
jgi:FtsK/SpoIIIE family/LysM domain